MSLASGDPDAWASDRDRVSGHHQEILEELFEADPPDAPDPFDDDAPLWMVTDDAAAGWCMRKIARANEELMRFQEAADYEVARIRRRLDEVSSPLARTIGFFEGRLVEYRRRLEDESPDLPLTYKLPHGDITRRAGRAKTVVTNEPELTAWALQWAPETVSVKPLTSRLKDERFAVTEEGRVVDKNTGELVPGVQVTVGSPSYGVKVR